MKRTFRIILKLIAWTGLGVIVLITCSYLWIRSSWTDVISEEQLDKLSSEIAATKPLPESFKKTLTQIYPNIFDKGLTGHALNQIFTDNEYQPCPCRKVAMTLRIDYIKANRTLRNFYPASLTWAIEDRLSQQQCLRYYLNNFDFTKGIIGIYEASEIYFNEELKNLTTEQHLELILKIKNPVLYDKVRRHDKYYKELEKLKGKLTGYNKKYKL